MPPAPRGPRMLYGPSCTRTLLMRRWNDGFYPWDSTTARTFALSRDLDLLRELQRRLPAPARLTYETPRGATFRASVFPHPAGAMLEVLAPVLERRLQLQGRRRHAATELLGERRRRAFDTRFDDAKGRLHPRSLDLRRRRDAKVGGQADGAQSADEPLGRIPLVPLDSVSEVRREAVMEGVIALAEREQSAHPVVASRDFRVVQRVSEEVRERVHEERGVVDDGDAEESAPEQPGNRVAEGRADERRHAEAADDENHLVPAMLPHHDRVLHQIGSVFKVPGRWIPVEDPEHVRPPEPTLNVVRIPVVVHVLVVHAVARRPPEDRVLRRHRAEEREESLHGRMRLVALVREEAVIARADGDADGQIHHRGQQWHPEVEAVAPRPDGRTDESDDRRQREEDDVDPVFFELAGVAADGCTSERWLA